MFIRRCVHPENWDYFNKSEQATWREWEQLLVDFYMDLRKKGLINIAFYPYALPEQQVSHENFQKILDFQQKMFDVGLLIKRICSSKGGIEAFANKNSKLMTVDELFNLFISYFGFLSIQAPELFRNVLLKTLNTDSLRHKNGKPVKNAENLGLMKLLDILKNYSDKTRDLKTLFLKDNKLRRIFAHGLFWFKFPVCI